MKHIIFDLDGTLIDSMPIWKNTGRDFLLNHGYPVPDNLHQIVKTQTLYQTAAYFHTQLGVTLPPEQIAKEIVDFVEDAYRHHIPLKPYAKDFLEAQKKKGSKMCILTASEADYVMPALERLQLLPYFQFIMTCSQEGHFKHEGEIFRIAMNRLGGTEQDTVVFEDALYAVKGAKKGGLTVYAVQDPVTEGDSAQIQNTADRFITDYRELL